MTPTEMERWCGEVEHWMSDTYGALVVMRNLFIVAGANAAGAQELTIPEPPRRPVVAS